MRTALIAGAIGGLTGGLLLWLILGIASGLMPGEILYTDLAAVLLTAVAVLVTALGVFGAIMAVWGYGQLKDTAENVALKHIQEMLEPGKKIQVSIEKLVLETIRKSLQDKYDDGTLTSLVKERVDQVAFSSKRSVDLVQDLDAEPNEEG